VGAVEPEAVAFFVAEGADEPAAFALFASVGARLERGWGGASATPEGVQVEHLLGEATVAFSGREAARALARHCWFVCFAWNWKRREQAAKRWCSFGCRGGELATTLPVQVPPAEQKE
jgi:hypothetical protein